MLKNILENLKKTNAASSQVTTEMKSFFLGTSAEESSQAFQLVHEKIDREIPERLLSVAEKFIIEPLTNYVKELDEMIPALKSLQEKQQGVKHYETKVKKLQAKGVTLSKVCYCIVSVRTFYNRILR